MMWLSGSANLDWLRGSGVTAGAAGDEMANFVRVGKPAARKFHDLESNAYTLQVQSETPCLRLGQL